VFPVRYELNFYILFRINAVFKGITCYLAIQVEGLGKNLNISVRRVILQWRC
jgi:hypothetical protein